MQLNRYSQDSDLIKQRFDHLYTLLSPSNNKFPFADEAFHHVCDAWYVLSNPLKKVEFDDSLKKLLDGEKSNASSDLAFWTVCPYCYYLYEYPRVYLNYCLRCSNEKCSRAFTCVEIDRPPVNVLREGKYMCTGFLPVRFQHGTWNPFAPLNKQKVNASDDDASKFVEISDDDGDGDEVEANGDKSFNVNGEGVDEGAGTVKMKGDMPSTKLSVKRKKSVAKKTKKVTGAGNRVIIEGFVNLEEKDMSVRSADNEGDGCEYAMSCGYDEGPLDSRNRGEIEFYDADDDILVSLQDDI